MFIQDGPNDNFVLRFITGFDPYLDMNGKRYNLSILINICFCNILA